ncbi:molybdopterin synthase catalytic subunit MoaE [Endozoicomonas lisbonensis]|uniref:Molybdopterin synthase catalytic subunit n=1 Tax=Endozoicomonas lisbonensis TaxID=3120522 RepID=A0ABV2SNA9_9GAMM
MTAVHISVQTRDFDPAREQARLSDNAAVGGIVTFTGLVRDNNLDDNVSGLYLEHYPGMTESALQAIAEEASERWSLYGVSIIHRVGQLHPTDRIVFVGTASAHRQDAFAACDFIMDYLKTRAPFWKKETTPEGDRWIEERQSDKDAAQRWEDRCKVKR